MAKPRSDEFYLRALDRRLRLRLDAMWVLALEISLDSKGNPLRR